MKFKFNNLKNRNNLLSKDKRNRKQGQHILYGIKMF